MSHYVGDNCSGGHAEEARAGFKFDTAKLRYDLVPPYPLSELAQVYTDGALKYGDENYRKGMSWRRVLASVIRHIEACRGGEWLDSESGSPHVAHAAWGCFTLMLYEKEGLGTDDRLSGLPITQENMQSARAYLAEEDMEGHQCHAH